MVNPLRKLLVPVLASRPVSALASRFVTAGVPVFSVHRLTENGSSTPGVTAQHLRNCLEYLRRENYHLLALEELLHILHERREIPERTVVFTMDDGYSEQAGITAGMFLEYDCPLTFFVITGLVDRALWPWDAQVSWMIDNTTQQQVVLDLGDETIQLDFTGRQGRGTARKLIRDYLKELDADALPEILDRLEQATGVKLPDAAPAAFHPLDWADARRLELRGVRFAPHSKTHRILSKLSAALAQDEIHGSWEVLERELASPLKVFCYPTGRTFDFGPREIGYLQEAGFLGAMSSIPGLVNSSYSRNDGIFRLPRIALPASMPYFIQYCSWIEQANRARQAG